MITRFDLIRTGFRTFYMQALWNYESLLGYGVAFALLPILEKLYSKEDIVAKGREYLSYFNSQPYVTSFIIGLLIRFEEETAEKQINNSLKISSVKTNYMGPLAALGDSFFWWNLKPAGLIISLFFILFFFETLNWSIFILVLFLLFFNFFHFFFRFGGIFYGYKFGEPGLKIFKVFDLNKFQKVMFELTIFISGIAVIMLIFNHPVSPQLEKINVLFTLPMMKIFYALVFVLSYFLYKVKNSPLLIVGFILILAIMISYIAEKQNYILRLI
ncbi:MAG: PTS system mannose/fructose/sorbose family transporter subunit IID [bacterium]|nr:PTS system mannose/fructose/sorbose family transporter subunit IID [bacterium]